MLSSSDKDEDDGTCQKACQLLQWNVVEGFTSTDGKDDDIRHEVSRSTKVQEQGTRSSLGFSHRSPHSTPSSQADPKQTVAAPSVGAQAFIKVISLASTMQSTEQRTFVQCAKAHNAGHPGHVDLCV